MVSESLVGLLSLVSSDYSMELAARASQEQSAGLVLGQCWPHGSPVPFTNGHKYPFQAYWCLHDIYVRSMTGLRGMTGRGWGRSGQVGEPLELNFFHYQLWSGTWLTLGSSLCGCGPMAKTSRRRAHSLWEQCWDSMNVGVNHKFFVRSVESLRASVGLVDGVDGVCKWMSATKTELNRRWSQWKPIQWWFGYLCSSVSSWFPVIVRRLSPKLSKTIPTLEHSSRIRWRMRSTS